VAERGPQEGFYNGKKVARFDILKGLEDFRVILDRMAMVSQ
jgi:hypothetical protein